MATSQDIDAITAYIQETRSLIPKYAGVLGNPLEKAIEAYEAWLSNLTWYGRYVDTDETFGKAKWYRDEINEILDRKLPEGWVPADANKAAETAAKKPGWWDKLSAQTQLGIIAGGVGITALAVLTAPMYLSLVRLPRIPYPRVSERYSAFINRKA